MPPVDWKKIVSDPSGLPTEEPVKEENYLEDFRARVRKSIDDGNISLSSVGIPEPPVERNIVGETAAALGRGVGKATEYTGRGIQELGGESVGGVLRSAGESIQQADILAPSEELKTGQAGLARRTLAGAAESIPMSAVPMALGAAGTAAGLAAGAATTVNPIGAAVGGAIGGLAGMATGVGTLFYEGTKSAERERALKEFEVAHPEWTPEQRAEEAEKFATTQAKWEALPEAASQALTAGIGMAVAKGVAKGGLTAGKTVLRDLLGTGGPKEMLKHVAKEYASEGGTELLTYFAQAENEKKYGIGEGPTLTGALDTAVTAAWFTGAAGAGMAGMNYSERNKTISGLNSENKLIRDKAAEKIEAKVAEKFGPDSAKQWRSIFESSVAEGKGGGFNIDSPLFGAATEAYAPEGGGVLEKALGATQPAAQPDENAQFEAASRAADEAAMEANPEYEAASALAGEAASEANSEAQFETESVAARKRAAGMPLDAAEEAALATAEQRLARPASVTGPVSPAQNTMQPVQQAGDITIETPEQAQKGYDAYQPEPPVNPASEYGQQQAEFERIQKEAAEYNRLKNIPDKLPELPEDLRSADSLSRPQLLAVAKKYNIPTVNDTGKAVGVKAAVKRFAESEQKRIASETRLRTPSEQARLDQLAGRTPERLAAQAQRERGIEFQRAAADLEAAPLKPAPGGEAYFAGVENIASEQEARKQLASREGEDVAAALPIMMRELSQGTAGRRLRNAGESYDYDADAGAYLAEPSSYPKWVQEDADLSKAGRATIERVAELGRTGGKMTDRQIDLWVRLKAAAQKEYGRNPEIQQGVEFDLLAADGYNFEAAEGGLLASDLAEGDSVALLEDGAIVRYTSQGVDENTGRVVLEKDGGGTKELGGFDPLEPIAVKLTRSEASSEVPFSKAQTPLENPADVRTELVNEYGAGWVGRAERRGLINIVSQKEADNILGKLNNAMFSILWHGTNKPFEAEARIIDSNGLVVAVYKKGDSKPPVDIVNKVKSGELKFKAFEKGRFDISRSGSGYGNIYGYGLYFSDVKSLADQYKGDGGVTYKVKLNFAKEDLLDFKKQIKDQGEVVKNSLISIIKNDKKMISHIFDNHFSRKKSIWDMHGGTLVNAVADYFDKKYPRSPDKSNIESSKYLLNHGIKGIVLDPVFSMKGNTENGREYVIFNDEEVSIIAKYSKKGLIEGFVTPDGKIHLVQGNIAKGQTLGVAAHELGSHAMRSGFAKEQAWLDVLEHSDRLLSKGDESVVEARRRAVEAGTPASLLREETVAYLSNIAPKHGIIRNLIAKLKQFMINNNLASKFFVSKLTAADLQALAQGATKAAIKGKAAPDWAKGVDARLSAKITPELRVEAQNKKGETVTRPLTAKALAEQKPLAPVKEAVDRRVAELRSSLTEGDMLARKIEQETQKKVSPRKQAQAEKDLLEQIRVFRKQHLQPEIQDMANEIFGTIDPEARRMTPAKETNLKATRAEIERLKAEGADIDPALEAKVARLDRRRIGDMLPGEAQALLDVAKELAYVNKTKNKLLAVERGQDAAELSKGIIAPIEAKPSKRYAEAKKTGQKAERGKNPIFDLGRQLLGDPASTFRTLMLDLGRANEKSSAVKLAQTVAERQNIELKHRKDLDEQLVKSIGKNWQAIAESKAWNAEQDVNGRKLTSGEKVYLKYSLNDQNVSDSIEKMGYRKKLDTKATKMSRAEREAIKLNPEEQRVYDALADYFESTYNILNPAHIIMKGWRLFKHEFGKYLPKSVSNLTLAEELGSIIKSGSLDGTGVTLDRLGTLNEINLKDIFEVIARQRDIASKYAAYAPMVRDFNLVFRSPELKNALQMEYGVEKNGKSIVENYVDDLLRDLQGNKPQSDSGVEAAVRKVRTNAAGALLAFRLTTPLMQMTGYPRALAHISPQNLAKALRMRGGFEEAVKWNMRAYARRDAGIDREIFDNRNKRLIRAGMAGIQKMDELVTGRLWSATKLQTAQETGLRGDELLKETSRRFDAVLDTQGGHTMADLSMTSRTQSELAKMFTIFSSDKFAMLNEIKRGLVIREHTGDWKPLARASAGMVLSAAMAAGVATAVGGAVSGKDKDYEEEFAKNLAGSLPLFDQLVSMFQGFNPSSAGIEAIGDAANAAGRIASLAKKQASGETVTAEQYSKALQSVVNSASLAAGVPVKNFTDNLGFAKRLTLGGDALEQVESELRGLEDFDFEERKAKITKGKQGAELRAALSKLRKEFAGLDQEKVAKARRLTAAKKRIKEIDKELEGEVPAAFRLRREKLREEIAARAVR